MLAALGASVSTLAQQVLPPPSAEDLQAAYCFGLAKMVLPANSDPNPPPWIPPSERAKYGALIAQQKASLERLQGYIAGRLGVVDATGLLIASKQAEADFGSSIASIARCAQACEAPPCNCVSPPHIQSKIERCKSLDFMPY
jgi:hypothetical protein